MKQYYFNYHGVAIKSGTIIKIKPTKGGYKNSQYYEEATFQWYMPDKQLYSIDVNGCNYILSEKHFYNILIEITNIFDPSCTKKINKNNNNCSFIKELGIDGMLVAWVWYIFLMCITTVFMHNIIWWVLISYVFFNYRSKKLREAGFK